jgi:hypothetical protein
VRVRAAELSRAGAGGGAQPSGLVVQFAGFVPSSLR